MRRVTSTAAAATLIAVLLPMPAEAAAGDCSSYQSIGASSPNAIEYGLPYEIYGGVPYVETEMSSQPKARALASGAYPGEIGEVLVGTSGAGVDDPSTVQVFYPAVQGEKSTDRIDHAPAVSTFATAAAGPSALAWAANGGGSFGGGVAVGPSYASSQASFQRGALSGHDETWSYDVKLGAAEIDAVHSVIDYRTDGSATGTTGHWRLDVLGIGSSGGRPVSVSGDGVSLEGGPAQPGPGARQQAEAASKQLSDQLEAAGVGRVDVSLEPGKVKVSPGRVELQGAEIGVTLRPQPTAGSIGQTVQLLLGYEERLVSMRAAACAGNTLGGLLPGAVGGTVVPPPSTSKPASGPLPSAASIGSSPAPAEPPAAVAAQPATVPVALPVALWPRRFYHWSLVLLLLAAGGLWLLYAAVHRPLARH